MPSKQNLELKSSLFIVVFLCFLSTSCLAQRKNAINYIIPGNVSDVICNYIKQKKQKHYAVLIHQNDTTFIIIDLINDSNKPLNELLKNSNRFLMVDSTVNIPVLLNEDLLFSDVLHQIINKGSAYEGVSHTMLNPAGFSVIYTGMYQDVSIIQAKYHQY